MCDIKLRLFESDKQVACTFDKCGNVYFSFVGQPKELYELTITRKNTLLCERYLENDNTNKDCTFSIGHLVPINANGNNGDNRDNGGDSDNDGEDEIDILNYDSDKEIELETDVRNKYLTEDLRYNLYVEKLSNEPYFCFNLASTMFSKIKGDDELHNRLIFDRESLHALYDTLVYEGAPGDAEIIMKTTLVNDNPIYRLCVYTSGDIRFRAIGSNELAYKLSYEGTNGLQMRAIE
jgi:hypothetical protein